MTNQPPKIEDEDLSVFMKWSEFIGWLFPHTENFPKKARFTFALRIENLALDVIEDLIEARYTKEKLGTLKRVNLRLEKMRILLRLAHDFHYISTKSYEYAAKSLNEIGRMIGGWIKQQEKR